MAGHKDSFVEGQNEVQTSIHSRYSILSTALQCVHTDIIGVHYKSICVRIKAGILAKFKRQYNINTKINISMKKSILLKIDAF